MFAFPCKPQLCRTWFMQFLMSVVSVIVARVGWGGVGWGGVGWGGVGWGGVGGTLASEILMGGVTLIQGLDVLVGGLGGVSAPGAAKRSMRGWFDGVGQVPGYLAERQLLLYAPICVSDLPVVESFLCEHIS